MLMVDGVRTANDSNKVWSVCNEGTILTYVNQHSISLTSHYMYPCVCNLIRSQLLVSEIKPPCGNGDPFMCTFCARFAQFVYKASYDFVLTLLEALFLSSNLILQIIDKSVMYNILHIDCQLPQWLGIPSIGVWHFCPLVVPLVLWKDSIQSQEL